MLVYGKHFWSRHFNWSLRLYRSIGEAIPQLHRPDFLCAVDGCSYQVVAQVNLQNGRYPVVHQTGRHGRRNTKVLIHLQSFSNAGEKALFWLLYRYGQYRSDQWLGVRFPNLWPNASRYGAFQTWIHMLAALILICGFVFPHLYWLVRYGRRTRGMVTGEVDETWARKKEHHDLWYKEVMEQKNGVEQSANAATEKTEGVNKNEQTSPKGIWVAYILSCFYTIDLSSLWCDCHYLRGLSFNKGEDGEVIGHPLLRLDSLVLLEPDVLCCAYRHSSDL